MLLEQSTRKFCIYTMLLTLQDLGSQVFSNMRHYQCPSFDELLSQLHILFKSCISWPFKA